MTGAERHQLVVDRLLVLLNKSRDDFGCPLGVFWGLVQGQATPLGQTHPIRFGLIRGAADIIGLLRSNGRFVAIEVKTGDAKPDVRQRAFLEVVNSNHGVGLVATLRNYELDWLDDPHLMEDTELWRWLENELERAGISLIDHRRCRKVVSNNS